MAGAILQVQGQLAASIESDYGRDYARMGSNKTYAPVMFFGAEKSRFRTTTRSGPTPWEDMPGQPFLGFNADIRLIFWRREY